MAEDYTPYDIGFDIASFGGGGAHNLFWDIFQELDYGDYWEDQADFNAWFNWTGPDDENFAIYGQLFEDLYDDWKDHGISEYNLFGRKRDLGLGGFREGFQHSDFELGTTGFSGAQNIGVQGDIGGTEGWMAEYQRGISPFIEGYESNIHGLYEGVGEDVLGIIAELHYEGAFEGDW